MLQISTKLYHKLGNFLLPIGASVITKLGELHFITDWGKRYYKFEQLHFITNCGKCYYKLRQPFSLQIGASVIANLGSLIITNQCKFYYKSGQLLQIRTTVIANWGKLYYKLGQPLQIGAIITNWGIPSAKLFT